MTDRNRSADPRRAAVGWASSPLAAAEHAFGVLVEPPAPLALDGRAVGHGLPAWHIPLDELRRLLLRGRLWVPKTSSGLVKGCGPRPGLAAPIATAAAAHQR
jgi:hypothetical protein